MVKVQEMIDEALKLVEANVQNNLNAGVRCRLLSTFDNGNTRLGKARRTLVAVLSIEKVLPIWEIAFPVDRSPHAAIELASRVVAGTIKTSEAEREIGNLWSHCDSLLFHHSDKQNSIMVGYGAAQAIRESLSNECPACADVGEGATDLDVEPYDNDASYFAAVAYCGGPPWDTSSDAKKRLEFWNWWLKVAFPSAMNFI